MAMPFIFLSSVGQSDDELLLSPAAQDSPLLFPSCLRPLPHIRPLPSLPSVGQSDDELLLSPETRLMLLDHVFLRFDGLAERAGVLKIETVGNVYLAAANVAHVAIKDHAVALSRLALQFVAAVREIEAASRAMFEEEGEGGADAASALALEVRIGINSGPLIGGVIGRLLPRYR